MISSPASGDLRSTMNGPANTVVGAAAADVARQGVIDLGVARVPIRGEKDRGCDDLTRLAVTALRNLFHQPGLLHWMASIVRQSLDRCYLLACRARKQYLARSDGIAFQDHSAGATLPDAASILCASKIKMIAEDPEQRCSWIGVNNPLLPIYCQRGFGHYVCPLQKR